jgi:hypothetical protein
LIVARDRKKRESTAVRDAVMAFYRSTTTKAVERIDDIISAEPASLVVRTAPRRVGDGAAPTTVRLRCGGPDTRPSLLSDHDRAGDVQRP